MILTLILRPRLCRLKECNFESQKLEAKPFSSVSWTYGGRQWNAQASVQFFFKSMHMPPWQALNSVQDVLRKSEKINYSTAEVMNHYTSSRPGTIPMGLWVFHWVWTGKHRFRMVETKRDTAPNLWDWTEPLTAHTSTVSTEPYLNPSQSLTV